MYKYQIIYNTIESRIQNGHYKQGERLPSIRKLCVEFACNKTTVLKGLERLKDRNLVYVMPQSGYFVVPTKRLVPSPSTTQLNFVTSSPDPNLFPYTDFQKCINQAINDYKEALFTYGTIKGLPSLIKVAKSHLMQYQVFTSEDNIFITYSVQQSLALLLDMPFPNGKETILIEQPTYHMIVRQLDTLNKPVKFIQRTDLGIDLEALEVIFQAGDIKFFYLMPRFHNPLGFHLPDSDKKRIIELAEQYDVYLVEDDYLADYVTSLKNDPLHAYDTDKSRVIYLKSFSKIMFPGLRVSLAVLPSPLINAFDERKSLSNLDTSILSQAALEIYLKSGMFEQHSSKMANLYDTRSQIMHDTLLEASKHTNAFHYHGGKSPSVHACIELNTAPPIKYLEQNDILCRSLEWNYSSRYHAPKHYLKINVSNVKEQDIAIGITRIIDLIKQKQCFQSSEFPPSISK